MTSFFDVVLSRVHNVKVIFPPGQSLRDHFALYIGNLLQSSCESVALFAVVAFPPHSVQEV